jgi:hypothetical protein
MSKRIAKAKLSVPQQQTRARKQTTLELLLTVITDQWKGDPSAPGVTLSRLPNGLYYGSLCRYHGGFGNTREIVAKAQDADLGKVIRILGNVYVAKADALAALRRAVK